MGIKSPTVHRAETLYAQLGGNAGVIAVVERFYKKIVADPDLKPFFNRTSMPAIKHHQVRFLTQALGGPIDSKNPESKPAHAHLLREPGDLDRAATHLAVALSKMNIAP